MSNPNVLFSRGASVTFPEVLKDPNTLYFLTDTHEIYLGSERYAIGSEVSVVIDGFGDTVSNVSWDAATKVLTLQLGDAGSATSVTDAIQAALSTCVKTIETDRGSSILVDDEDPEHIKLSLNLAKDEHAGNVLLEECSDGLRANVVLPEAPVQGVASNDKILQLNGSLLTSTLSITSVKEDDTTYVVLKGIDGQEISRFDAADFVKDGMLDSVALEYAPDGSNHRVIVFTFNTASGKETIRVDVQEFINIYTADPAGGLRLDDSAFSIANEVDPSGPINEDVAPAFGETVTLRAVKYDGHGLITGTGEFTFKMPEVAGGAAGGSKKLLKYIEIGQDGGIVNAVTSDISTAIDSSSTDSQIPTAKAVFTAIEDAKTIWERF